MNTKDVPDIKRDPLRYCLQNDLISQDGLWLEFGVYKGQTLDLISQYTDNNIYGFDTFSGIKTKWNGTGSGTMENFNIGGTPPRTVTPIDPDIRYGPNTGNKRPFKENVNFICGKFKKTLPDFFKKHDGKISLLHIDCDVYDSTKTILENCKINKDCIVIFDELVNYKGYKYHEIQAFTEFISDNQDFKFEWIGMDGPVLSDEELDAIGEFDKLSAQKQHEFMKNPPGFSVALRVL